jgi:hypothetical protein
MVHQLQMSFDGPRRRVHDAEVIAELAVIGQEPRVSDAG